MSFQKVRDIFMEFDVDRSNAIDLGELQSVLKVGPPDACLPTASPPRVPLAAVWRPGPRHPGPSAPPPWATCHRTRMIHTEHAPLSCRSVR